MTESREEFLKRRRNERARARRAMKRAKEEADGTAAARRKKAKKKGRKPATDDDDLVDWMVHQLASHKKKYQIRRAFEAEFGKRPSVGVLQRLITTAQARMIVSASPDPEEMVAKQVEFYQSVIADNDVAMKDRIKAAERLDALLGHDYRHLHKKLKNKDGDILREALKRMEEDGV